MTTQRLRSALVRVLPWLTAVWVFVELLSLRLPILNAFFFDTAHADVQGIDFYALPKAWLNLTAGGSLYGTFDPPTFGPHFTWYLAHPLLAVVLGWPLSHLEPTDSYGAFTIISLTLMAASAALLARETTDLLRQRLIWLLLLGAFPTFDMLFVGNVQSITVFGLTLLFVGLLRLTRSQPGVTPFLVAGLLISLFTKPVVLLACPLLVLLPETRRATLDALGVYVPVSLLFQLVPALNPQRISLGRILFLARHPQFVQSTMNIYTNHFVLTHDMRDNSIHWFNLLAQAGFRLQHIDVFSLPVFLDGLFGTRTPGWLYFLPTAAVLVLSFIVPRLPDRPQRTEAAFLLVLAASLDFFLTYPTVWEYQYTAVLPVAGALLLLPPTPLLPRALRNASIALAACAALPSLYVLSGSAAPTNAVLTLTRLDRVLPVTALFVLLLWTVLRAILQQSSSSGAPLPQVATVTPIRS